MLKLKSIAIKIAQTPEEILFYFGVFFLQVLRLEKTGLGFLFCLENKAFLHIYYFDNTLQSFGNKIHLAARLLRV